ARIGLEAAHGSSLRRLWRPLHTAHVMFLKGPPGGEERERVFASDLDSDGYVNNLTRLWCWRPDLLVAFTALRQTALDGSSLTDLEVAVLVASTASARSDSYCSLAW